MSPGACTYCGRPFGRGAAERVVEHVEPLSRGGADLPENTVPACLGCNSSKGDSFLLEWV